MSNNKQSSSVEWLQWALEHTILTHEQIMQTIGLFEQAKAMEKQQIIDTYKKAQVLMVMDSSKQAEQYYNEEYGSKESDKCCTPKGQIKRYIDCIGCDKNPKNNNEEYGQ